MTPVPRSLSLLVLALVAALSGCGGPLLYAEVEIPQVCLGQGGLPVPGAGASRIALPVTVPIATQIPLLRTRGIDTVVHIDELSLEVSGGSGPDLSGIDSATVNLFRSGGEVVALLHYTRDPAAGPVSRIVLTGDRLNVAPDLVNGAARLEIVAEGRPPAGSWVADLRTCASGRSKAGYP